MTAPSRAAAVSASAASPNQLPRTNLPLPLTPLVGRENELSDLADKIVHPDCRLLTLVGQGASAKYVSPSRPLAEILKRAPNVMLLVTSRECLNLTGEWLYEVEGLHTPPPCPPSYRLIGTRPKPCSFCSSASPA